MALATIISSGIYYGRVVDHKPASDQDKRSVGMVCIEEMVSPMTCLVPVYISQLQSYSEMDCRHICLQVAHCIRILHDAGIAHRNLHVENILIDPLVRILATFVVSLRLLK